MAKGHSLAGWQVGVVPNAAPFRRNSETCFVSFRGRRPRNLIRERFLVPLRGTRNDIPGGSDCHCGLELNDPDSLLAENKGQVNGLPV